MALDPIAVGDMKVVRVTLINALGESKLLSGTASLGTLSPTTDYPNKIGDFSVENLCSEIDNYVTSTGYCIISTQAGSVKVDRVHSLEINSTQGFTRYYYSSSVFNINYYKNGEILQLTKTATLSMVAPGQNSSVEHYFGFSSNSPSNNSATYIRQFYSGVPDYHSTLSYFYRDNLSGTIYSTINTSGYWYSDYSLTYAILNGDIVGSFKYTITVTEPSYGTCTVSKTEAEGGDTITVICTPNAGYKLYDVFVVGDEVGRIPTEKTSLNVQTFAMPGDNVKVSAIFVSIDPYRPGGDTQPQDRGEGTFDNTSDEIVTPDELTLNYSDSGLVRLFNPDAAKLKNFGDFLWSNLIDYDTIKKAFSNPMDQIISLHTIPIGLSTTTEEEVVFGGIGSGVSMRPLTKQFYKVNMGTLHIPRFYATALDYSPFTRLQLYLPFIGEKDIDADEVMGKDLSVSYQIDALSGAAVAYVSISGQLVYMFSGNAAQYIPVSQSNFSGLINGVTGIAGAIASVAGGLMTLSGNAPIGAAINAIGAGTLGRETAQASSLAHQQVENRAMAVSQFGQGAGNLVNALTGKPNTAHIGLAQGVAGYMSYPTPYVLIKRPHQSLATNFYSQYGYPANLSLNLAELSGFCKLASIDITSFPGTASELAELKHILQSGFYIRGNTAPTYTTTSGLTIAFEHSNSETNACGKSLTTVAALTGELRQESNLLNPVIDIQGNIESYLTANEVCIPTFYRRYFITEWTAVRKNLFRIHLHCDVLQSFWDSIKSAPCIVERYENQWTLDLNDPYFQVSQDLLMQQLKFTSSFQLSNSSFVLAIAGNGATII